MDIVINWDPRLHTEDQAVDLFKRLSSQCLFGEVTWTFSPGISKEKFGLK